MQKMSFIFVNMKKCLNRKLDVQRFGESSTGGGHDRTNTKVRSRLQYIKQLIFKIGLRPIPA